MTLLLLHGFTSSPESWRPITTRPACTPALLGHTGGPQEGTTFEAEADRLAATLPPLAPTAPGHTAGSGSGTAGSFAAAAHHLVGYSLGARVGLGMLVRHRGLFSRATLVGVHPGLEEAGEREARRRGDERWAEVLEREGIGAFVEAWERQALFATQAGLRAEVLAAQREVRMRQDPRGLALSLRVLGLARMPSYWDALPGLDLPIHLLAGELDAKFRAIAERMVRLLPNATLTVVPGCGHNLLLEAPDAVARAIER